MQPIRRSLFSALFLAVNFAFAIPMDFGAQKGILILDGNDINERSMIPLAGEWEFFLDKKLSPKDIWRTPGIRKYLEFNTIWNNALINRKPISNTGVSTYHLIIIVKNNDLNLGLSVNSMFSSYNLFVNDSLLANNGVVGLDKKSTKPDAKPSVVRLPNKDTLDIVVQVANFHHTKGGADKYLILGKYSRLSGGLSKEYNISYYVLGILVMSSFFFMAMFLVSQKEMSLLYFSIFCLAVGYRVIGSDLYPINAFLPHLSWFWKLRFEYLSLYLSAASFALYTTHLYPNERPNTIVLWAFYGICGFLSLLTLFFSPSVFTWFDTPYLITLLAFMVLATMVYMKASSQRRAGSRFALISTIIVLISFLYQTLYSLGMVERMPFLNYTAFIIFFLSHSYILIYIFALNYRKAKEDADLASRAKSDFLSTMSHEMRTPLNAIINATNFLQEENPRADQMDSLHILKIGSENLNSVINDILDYNKIESGKLEVEEREISIVQLIENCFKLLKPKSDEKSIKLDFKFDKSIPEHLVGDPVKLNQVLINLLGNAIKFTNQGTVTLFLEKVYLEESRVSIKFSVVDTGIGIAKEKQAQIFDRFAQASSSTTRRFGGSGLGLSITKRLVEIMGGRIYLYSKEGQGARFYFTLNFKIQDIRKKLDVEQEIDKTKLYGKKVLVVEDNDLNVKVLRKFLDKWQIQSDVAINGVHAVDKVAEEDYDLIIMDLQMPVMDGYETTSTMRRNGVRTPIIALTADATSDVVARVHRIGMNDCITKPFNPSKLIRKIYYFISSNRENSVSA